VQRGKGGPLTFGAGKAAGGSFVNIKELRSMAAYAVRRETRGHTAATLVLHTVNAAAYCINTVSSRCCIQLT